MTDYAFERAQLDIHRYVDPIFAETEGQDTYRVDFEGATSLWLHRSGEAEGGVPKIYQRAVEEFCYHFGFDMKGIKWI